MLFRSLSSLQRNRRLPPAIPALATILLALAAHAPALPWPAWPVLLLAAASRLLPGNTAGAVARLSLVAIACLGAAALWGWFDAATLRAVLLTVLVLKWAESRRPTEFALVACAATVATAIGLLQWGEGSAALLAVTSLVLLVFSISSGSAAWGKTLLSAGRHIVGALPLAAVLFVFFPRIPGPLWDIGLSFGLPLPVSIEKSNQGLGISARLKPGQTQTGATDGQPVLVAEFRNWVPPTSQLYWRGPVFYDFDGREWRLDADYAEGNGRRIMQHGWRRAADFGQTFQSSAQRVDYKVRLTPHQGLWLYGLDIPARLTAESFVGPDWQVLSHTPVRQEISYELSSWLEWTGGNEIDPAMRERALALPAGSNPRLRALGEQLHQRGENDIPRQALIELARGGYKVRDRFTPPEGEHALDTFWFERKEGNSEFYAAAFVVLMRSAGVPARLVTGYRGGKLMALTDYVVVKRSHAHAWAEVWDEAKGWRRIDAVDMIAPEKFAGAAGKPKSAPQPAPAAPPAPGKPKEAGKAPSPVPVGGYATAAAPRPVASEGWHLPDIEDWLGRWVFKLDAERQKDLLAGQGGGLAWLWLLVVGALGGGLVFGGNLLLQRWRERRRVPAPERAWRRACRLLARRGWPVGASECPTRYAARIGEARPAWAESMRGLATAYAGWRYGKSPADAGGRVPGAARLLINRILSQ